MFDDCEWCRWFDPYYGCLLPNWYPCPIDEDEDLW